MSNKQISCGCERVIVLPNTFHATAETLHNCSATSISLACFGEGRSSSPRFELAEGADVEAFSLGSVSRLFGCSVGLVERE